MEIIPTDPELQAFVGPKARYYLKAWRPILTGKNGPWEVNIAAFFFPLPWLAYRKMYTALILLIGISFGGSVFEFILSNGTLSMQEMPAWFELVCGLAVSAITSIFGNRWYLSRARKVISKVRSRGLSEEAHLSAVAARGGTDICSALGLVVLAVLIVLP